MDPPDEEFVNALRTIHFNSKELSKQLPNIPLSEICKAFEDNSYHLRHKISSNNYEQLHAISFALDELSINTETFTTDFTTDLPLECQLVLLKLLKKSLKDGCSASIQRVKDEIQAKNTEKKIIKNKIYKIINQIIINNFKPYTPDEIETVIESILAVIN